MQTGTINKFTQGSLCQKNELFSRFPYSLQLILYHDDFGVSNPLGNKIKFYKTSAFYFVLGNIPAKYRSRLKDIQLALLFPSELTGKYGYESLIQPLIEDIKILETTSIEIAFEGRNHIFRGTVTMVVADNLALHALGGFFCNFNTVKKFCRFCNVSKQGQKEQPMRKDWKLRTRAGYDSNITQLVDNPEIVPAYRIKSNSCLNELSYFHAAEGLPPDLAHDVLEGIAVDVISDIVGAFVEKNIFHCQNSVT